MPVYAGATVFMADTALHSLVTVFKWIFGAYYIITMQCVMHGGYSLVCYVFMAIC